MTGFVTYITAMKYIYTLLLLGIVKSNTMTGFAVPASSTRPSINRGTARAPTSRRGCRCDGHHDAAMQLSRLRTSPTSTTLSGFGNCLSWEVSTTLRDLSKHVFSRSRSHATQQQDHTHSLLKSYYYPTTTDHAFRTFFSSFASGTMRDQMDLSPTWPDEHGGWVNTPGVKANVHEHLIETNDIWVSEDGSGSAFSTCIV